MAEISEPEITESKLRIRFPLDEHPSLGPEIAESKR